MTGPLDEARRIMTDLEPVDLDGVELPDTAPPAEPPPEGSGEPPYDLSAREPLNDYGNGRRFAIHFGEDLMWVPRVGWFTWIGTVWQKDPDAIEVRRKAQKVAEIITAEIPYLIRTLDPRTIERIGQQKALREELDACIGEDGKPLGGSEARAEELKAELARIAVLLKRLGDMKSEHRRFAKAAGNTARISALMTEGQIGLARAFDELDAGHLDVNTMSGVLRFRVDGGPGTGFSRTASFEVVPHERGQWLTKIMPVAYDPNARAPLFEAFLDRVQPVPAMRGFLQRWFGYSMTGLTSEQKLAFLYGSGANGKSVLVDVIARVLGDYSATAKIESLTGRNRRSGGDATPDLVPLMGARFVRASEPEQGERLQEGKIKELTGGEPILVRALNEDFIEVQPRFKLTISGNHKPEVRGTDDGIWRRLLLVPFDVQVPKEERDPLLVEKLVAEGPGIVNWLVEGLVAYLEDGLQEPDAVLAATADYRAESDPIGAFLAERCQVTGRPDHWLSTSELVDGFNLHCALEGMSAWRNRTIALGLKEKADRWRHPRDGLTFSAQKRSVSGYGGLRWTDFFEKTLREAPRDGAGRVLPPRASASDDDAGEIF